MKRELRSTFTQGSIKGSIFSFELPECASEAAQHAHAAVTSDGRAARPPVIRHVLLVDDDPAPRENAL